MTTPSQDNTVTRLRREIRRAALARREALSAEIHAALSAQVSAHLRASLPGFGSGVVGFCWPVRNEPDLRGVVTDWIDQGGQAALPVVVAEEAPLIFRAWTPDSPLAADRYGIPFPVDGARLQPDVLLLPLNAFDAAGYRLGYGGGYFDRTLATLTPRPLAVGVGFELGRVDSVQPQSHDQRLDWIVTEAGAWPVGS